MILAVPKNTLNAQTKAAATKKGYIIIECDDPEKIRVINTEQSMDTSDWFMAALKGCLRSQTSLDVFANDLYKRLSQKEVPTPPTVDNLKK